MKEKSRSSYCIKTEFCIVYRSLDPKVYVYIIYFFYFGNPIVFSCASESNFKQNMGYFVFIFCTIINYGIVLLFLSTNWIR